MPSPVVVYPGTFDPPTFGHLDIIKRASKIFSKVIVAITDGTGKKPLFSIDERIVLLKNVIEGLENVEVDSFEGLLINYVREKGIKVILRGLRVLSDFEYELQMTFTNNTLAPEIETIFMITSEQYSHINSTLIKEICSLGGNLKDFVPPPVEEALKRKLQDGNKFEECSS